MECNFNVYCLLVILLLLCGILVLQLRGNEVVLEVSSNTLEYEIPFNYNSSDERLHFTLASKTVSTKAKIWFSFHLFENSTENMTLIIEPEDEWLETSMVINPGEMVNKTVINDGFEFRGYDVVSHCDIVMYRQSISEIVQGILQVHILSRGETRNVSFPVIPVILAILMILIPYRSFKRPKD